MKRSTGFTLIEILVVIAILAGLVGILMPNFMEVRQRARDSQRKNDLKAIQKALEFYKEDKIPPTYPTGLPDIGNSWIGGNNSIYMSKIPGDPSGACQTGVNRYYYYMDPMSDPLQYVLYACLENKSDPEGVICPVNPNSFQGLTGCACASSNCYKVTNP